MMKKLIIGLSLMSSFLYLSCNKEEQQINTSKNNTEFTTLSAIQSVNGVYTFENWEVFESFLTANTNHTSLQELLTSGGSIVIGEDILKVVNNEYLVTSRVSNYTNYSTFTSATFDANTMNQISILLDREETFSLKEFLYNNNAGVVENNDDLPAVTLAGRRFWGSDPETCGDPYLVSLGEFNGKGDCERVCTTKHWTFWIGTKSHRYEKVGC